MSFYKYSFRNDLQSLRRELHELCYAVDLQCLFRGLVSLQSAQTLQSELLAFESTTPHGEVLWNQAPIKLFPLSILMCVYSGVGRQVDNACSCVCVRAISILYIAAYLPKVTDTHCQKKKKSEEKNSPILTVTINIVVSF